MITDMLYYIFVLQQFKNLTIIDNIQNINITNTLIDTLHTFFLLDKNGKKQDVAFSLKIKIYGY